MQVTETQSDGLKRGFTVVLPAADIEQRRTKRLSELSKTLKLPGFRPGKVPMGIVRQRFGTAVNAEVLEQSVDEATQLVLSERGLRPALQPKVDLGTVEDAKDLEFRIEVELLPDIAMPDFSAIELTRLRAEPSEEAIDRGIAEIADRQKEYVDVEPRPARAGDRLVIDYVGTIDDVAFPGGTGTDVTVEVSGPGFIPGFTEQLDGISPGEQRVISVTFPEDYQAKELAGKAATFAITAKTLREPVTQAAEGLAETLGFESLDELRNALRMRFQREYDELSRLRLKRQLLDALAEQANFAAPEGMVENEFAQIWQRLDSERKNGQLDAEDAGKDDETLKSEYRAIAARRVRLGLLLAEVGRVNGITVAADELNRAMRIEAAKYRGQEQQVLEFFRKNPQAADTLRGPIFEDKVIDFVVELAKVTDQTVAPEELAAEPPAAQGENTGEGAGGTVRESGGDSGGDVGRDSGGAAAGDMAVEAAGQTAGAEV